MATTQEYPQLGRYQVINRIASGGMAEVFLAKAVGAMGFQRLVAVKLIHSNFTRDEDFVKMFIDEARIAMHLHHRNIVQVFDLDRVAGTYFIAMEYVHGVNLYHLYERIAARDRWIDPPLALYLITEVCKGLHFAHTRKDSNGRPMTIIHRDISPQNVLLSFEGEVKITDFGIATAAQRLHQTAAGIVKGKYAYMAPERLQEQPVDARVDVFSTGVLLYELLAGENPFAGGSAVDTIENVLQREVPPPSARGAPITRELDEICLRALDKDRDRRFPSTMALADALTEYAMDLTMARKDMAAGDASVAQLLGELFPHEARSQPVAAEPGTLVIPGVDETAADSAPDDDDFGPDDALADRTTADDSGVDDDDFDAPTVLKMKAVTGLEDIPTPRARPRAQTELSSEPEDTGANTAPTEIPDFHAAHPRESKPEGRVDAFARTVQRRAGIETVPDNPPLSPPSTPSADVRPSTHGRPRSYPPPIVTPSRSLPPREPGGHGAAGRSGPDSHESLVVPVDGGRRRPNLNHRRLNSIAAALLVLAVVVVLAAVIAVRKGSSGAEVMLSVQTQPPGASVFVDGQQLEGRTPIEERLIAGQPVTLELELAGHHRVRKELTPRSGEAVVVDEAMRAIEGQLVVIPTPVEADVTIDGRPRGKGRVQVNGLPLDRPIEVEVALDGYGTFTQALELTTANPHQTLAVPLAPEPRDRRRPSATRRVTLTAPYGRWATVFYRGVKIGSTPTEVVLPVGSVRLRLRNDEIKLDRVVRIRVPRSGSDQIELPL